MKNYIKKEIVKQDGMFANREKTVFDFEELFYDWFESLSQDEQQNVLKSLSLEDAVLSALLQRLADNDHSFWSSQDGESMIEVLGTVEESLISRLQWSAMQDLSSELTTFIKAKRHDKELYWKMYHDEVHGEFFQSWFKKHGIESHYMTDVADKEIEEIKQMIASALDKLQAR